jgi:aspartate beta-hydroxylase
MSAEITTGGGGPDAQHERSRRLLATGDALGARGVLQRLVAAVPGRVDYWLSLAAVLRVLRQPAEELAVLDRALVLEPTHLVVLLQKASVLELMNKPRAAAMIYANALQTLPTGARLAAPIAAHVAHARQRVAENSRKLGAVIDARLAALNVPPAAAGARLRFDRSMDRLLGRQRVFNPEPTFLLFPFLSNYEFHPRDAFPWLERLEAATDLIRDELLAVLASDAEEIEPYIAYREGLPLNQWRELNHSRRWGAYFLWNQGALLPAHAQGCPRTVEALRALPQVDVAGHGPTAFFSILEPRTRIPSHTGVTNTRLTVHLPLIVPPGCRFRVGGETREWRVGTAWVFDDTIEHEAWNDSDAPRAILIFDVWNPQLTTLERDLVREATVALAEYSDAEGEVHP